MGHVVYVAPSYDQGPLLNRVSMAMYTVAVAFVVLRGFTRGCVVKKFGLDDLFITIAVTLGGAQTVTIILQVENGNGRHSSELHVQQYNDMLMYKWINMLIYFVANWTVKMSILALYYRIGSGRQGLPWIVQSKAVWVIAGIMTAFSLAVFIAQIFVCAPVSRAWDIESLPEGCFNGPLFMMISGAINVVTDVVLLLLPLPLLPLLKFNKRQRTALAMILSIGLIPVVASTMRLCEIVMSDMPTAKDMTWQEGDLSWAWAWVPVWSQIEVDIGIVAASLPCLSPLLKQVCSGFHCPSRASTPSQVPTLPGYRESWGEKKVGSLDDDVEKSLNAKEFEMSFYDDELSDVEEEKEHVGVAKTADARVILRPGAPRMIDYTKL